MSQKTSEILIAVKGGQFKLPNKARLNDNKSILFRKSVKNELNRVHVLKAKKIFPAPEHQHIIYVVRQH